MLRSYSLGPAQIALGTGKSIYGRIAVENGRIGRVLTGDGPTDFAVDRSMFSEFFVQGSRGGYLYEQVGQGGTSDTLRSLGTTSLGVPGAWSSYIASPGASQSAGLGNSVIATTTTSPTIPSILPVATSNLAPVMVVVPKRPTSVVESVQRPERSYRRDHLGRGRAGKSGAIAYLARSSAAKKA